MCLRRSSFFWACFIFRSTIWSLRRPKYAILSRFSGTPLALGRPQVSGVPSKHWRRSLDKQGGAHFCTGGPSSLLGAQSNSEVPNPIQGPRRLSRSEAPSGVLDSLHALSHPTRSRLRGTPSFWAPRRLLVELHEFEAPFKQVWRPLVHEAPSCLQACFSFEVAEPLQGSKAPSRL